jgi:hypothetical protein
MRIVVANSFRTGSVDSIDRNIGMIVKNLRKKRGRRGSRFSGSTVQRLKNTGGSAVQSSGLRVRGSGFTNE